ncbi:MAG: EF-P beta-lysylation protein EpmB, partial [Sedimenticolaceae bacterium]
MITLSPPPLEIHPWQQELAAAITDVNELLSLLGLEEGDVVGGVSPAAAGEFRLRVPRYFAGLMRRGDPNDPLLAQVLPR